MFNNLPKQAEGDVFKSGQNKQKFLEALPNIFQKKVAIELGAKFNLKERSVSAFLKSCLNKYLLQPQFGMYEKIEQMDNLNRIK